MGGYSSSFVIGGEEKKGGFDDMMTDEWMIHNIRELKKEGVFEFVCNIVILPCIFLEFFINTIYSSM